jgi:hypothetical protein
MVTVEELQRRFDLYNQGYWEVPDNLDTTDFDFDWRPDPYDRPYIHQFGTQWQKTNGPRFIVPSYEGVKYQSFQTAKRLVNNNDRGWRPLVPNATIDFSWHPDENDPPYIYVFGNQWYSAEVMPTIQYRVKGASEKKYINDVKATILPDKSKWIIPEGIDDSMFDYSWVPNPYEPPFIWQFGTQWQKNGGPCYVAEGSTIKKYTDEQQVKKSHTARNFRVLKPNVNFDYTWHPDEDDPPYNYVFGNQWYDAEIMPTVIYRIKGATETKYINTVKATLLPDKTKWFIPEYIDDSMFDYSWVPKEGEEELTHEFGTQWQKNGGPKYLGTEHSSIVYQSFQKVIKLFDPNSRYWRVPEEIEDGFDFSWHPDNTEPPLIYEFGTQWQKNGGPIYAMPKATGTKQCDDQIAIRKPNIRAWRKLEQIEDTFDYSWHPDKNDLSYNCVFGSTLHSAEMYPTLMYKAKDSFGTKYVNDIHTTLKIEVIEYIDSMYNALMENKFDTVYAHFVRKNAIPKHQIQPTERVSVQLFGDEAFVPRVAKIHLYDKITDYDNLVDHNISIPIEPLDIIFISNGEQCAEENYQHLLKVASKFGNRVVRVDNVNGRVASQHAAANISNTHWYFLVNAKLKVNENFDFHWQPNVYKSRRHYIFTATNALNELEYGHQAIVANNKILTLDTVVRGLDFTMDSKHEVVTINSGIGMYNSSPWDTWRTAFRECIKLCYARDNESKERLEVWKTVANGNFAQYSIQGAQDAVDYFNAVNGDLEMLKLSYEWDWLKTKFNKYL